MSTRCDWTVVIAARSPKTAKSRLAVLGDKARQELAKGFLHDVLDCLAQVTAVGEVIVLTDVNSWPGLCAIDEVVRVVPDQRRGLNTELTCAAAGLPRPLAFMLGDLPCVRPTELGQALEEACAVPAGVVPDRNADGTTLLTFGTRRAFAHFGSDSHNRHRVCGAATLGTSLQGLRHDVDVPADLLAAHTLGTGRHTRRALEDADLPDWFRARLKATSPSAPQSSIPDGRPSP